ncbi:hypothetical protein HYH03_004487 [Edaphochlamys debaryana]|uniref:Uncharacterized protein n=1 Tax=Edaphochlamys debaryana TaxID=47281 RepID=A0A836C2Z3_9CHLO|nr:hypothetical protein HYH03_004487 [Edaphochlamys debaryana]|eukprot:KAG2497322.1 hypothetical protein HYH03_004487 [Edaphochlamys debaryana]
MKTSAAVAPADRERQQRACVVPGAPDREAILHGLRMPAGPAHQQRLALSAWAVGVGARAFATTLADVPGPNGLKPAGSLRHGLLTGSLLPTSSLKLRMPADGAGDELLLSFKTVDLPQTSEDERVILRELLQPQAADAARAGYKPLRSREPEQLLQSSPALCLCFLEPASPDLSLLLKLARLLPVVPVLVADGLGGKELKEARRGLEAQLEEACSAAAEPCLFSFSGMGGPRSCFTFRPSGSPSGFPDDPHDALAIPRLLAQGAAGAALEQAAESLRRSMPRLRDLPSFLDELAPPPLKPVQPDAVHMPPPTAGPSQGEAPAAKSRRRGSRALAVGAALGLMAAVLALSSSPEPYSQEVQQREAPAPLSAVITPSGKQHPGSPAARNSANLTDSCAADQLPPRQQQACKELKWRILDQGQHLALLELQVRKKDEQLREKDERLRVKDEQLRERDEQLEEQGRQLQEAEVKVEEEQLRTALQARELTELRGQLAEEEDRRLRWATGAAVVAAAAAAAATAAALRGGWVQQHLAWMREGRASGSPAGGGGPRALA